MFKRMARYAVFFLIALSCQSVLAAHLGIQPGTLSRAFNQLAEYDVIPDRSSHIIF